MRDNYEEMSSKFKNTCDIQQIRVSELETSFSIQEEYIKNHDNQVDLKNVVI